MALTYKQRFSLSTLAILMSAASYAAAQAGSLDPTFGKNGIVATAMRSASAVAIQSDGKIVLAGTGVANDQLADELIRLNTDGSLDTSFGSGGTANLTPPTTGYVPLGFYAITIQSNGEIVAAGIPQACVNGTYSNFVQVARVKTNGTLDTSFGSGGFTATSAITSTPYDDSGPQVVALAVEANGSILVASSYFDLMARFTSTGQLDTAFGTAGLVNLA